MTGAGNDDTSDERERWNEKHVASRENTLSPSAFLVAHDRVLPRSGRALVLGCGTGRNLPLLARNVDVLAVDISDVAVERAREHVARHGLAGRVEVLRGDVNEIINEFPAASFDVVTSIDFFEPTITGEVRRLVRPGGTIVLQAFTVNDERLRVSRVKDKLVDPTGVFTLFPGYWILVHEIEQFTDDERRARERVNMIVRKPL